ncbi:MAG TPA: cytochrome P450 [Trebonia sp.]|nr:cytochrome P450 [Trebonia sp.]
MAADSLTVPVPGASADPPLPGAGWREEARSAVHWGVGHGLPRLAVRSAARRGDLQGRLMVAASTGDEVWQLFEEARASGPLQRSRFAYLTVDHAIVKEVLSSPDFRSGPRPVPPGLLGRLLDRTAPRVLHPVEPPSLLVTEPPDHTRYRRLVTRVFTVREVERLRVRAEAVARELLDALDPAAEVDLIEAYCSRLPLTVISEILGVPPEQRALVLEMASRATPSLDSGIGWRQYREMMSGLRGFAQWLDGHIERLRRQPGEDLLSQLIVARDEEGALDDRELKSTAALVLAAGFETTVNLLGNAIALLDQHPDQRMRLQAEPELWANAVDEALRLDPPVLMTARTCVRPTVLAGVEIAQDAIVATALAGANRDPQVFPDPARFDVARPNARDHVSFSGGRHYCLGASLARMEGEVGLRVLAERFPGLRLLPGARRRPTRILRGYVTLPARLR